MAAGPAETELADTEAEIDARAATPALLFRPPAVLILTVVNWVRTTGFAKVASSTPSAKPTSS